MILPTSVVPASMSNYYGSTQDHDNSGLMLQSTILQGTKLSTEDEGVRSFILQDWRECILLISTIFNCMSSGMMFIFSNTIMPALGKLSDEMGIEIMVTINDVILNPLFKLLFMGGLVSIIPVFDMMISKKTKQKYSKPARYYATASLLLYFFGQIVITATQNVPRNDVLLSLDGTSQIASEFWRNEYLTKWVSWNTARTIFSSVASIFGVLALYFMGKGI